MCHPGIFRLPEHRKNTPKPWPRSLEHGGQIRRNEKGISGLIEPKCYQLKQTSWVSALKKYYNADVPGGSNWKSTKTPSSQSTSVEPTKQTPIPSGPN